MRNRAYMYVQQGWRIFINHSVVESADLTLDSDANPPGSFSKPLLPNGRGKLMPVEGRGKPLPPALGGWRPGFLPSGKAEVISRPKIQMEYTVLKYVVECAMECILLAIIGDLVYQAPQNAHFL